MCNSFMYLDALFSFSSFLIIVEHSIMNQMSWKHMNEVFLFNFAYAYEMRESTLEYTLLSLVVNIAIVVELLRYLIRCPLRPR